MDGEEVRLYPMSIDTIRAAKDQSTVPGPDNDLTLARHNEIWCQLDSSNFLNKDVFKI